MIEKTPFPSPLPSPQNPCSDRGWRVVQTGNLMSSKFTVTHISPLVSQPDVNVFSTLAMKALSGEKRKGSHFGF